MDDIDAWCVENGTPSAVINSAIGPQRNDGSVAALQIAGNNAHPVAGAAELAQPECRDFADSRREVVRAISSGISSVFPHFAAQIDVKQYVTTRFTHSFRPQGTPRERACRQAN